MDKLEHIKLLLENNPNVKIANIQSIDRRANPYLLFSSDIIQYTNFNISPKDSFEIDNNLSKKLNLFMQGLISSLQPTEFKEFEQEKCIRMCNNQEKEYILLKMGELCFDEIFPVNIENFLRLDNKKYVETFLTKRKADYIAKTIITPFPNKETAERYQYSDYIGYIRLDLNSLII